MRDTKDTTKFVFKHHDKFFDPRWYEYKIYDADTNQLLFESYEERQAGKTGVSDLFTEFTFSQIKIVDADSKEYVRIEKRNSLWRGFYSSWSRRPRYYVYDENEHVLGEFKPKLFFYNNFYQLNVYGSSRNRVLQVRRWPLSSKWSFFAGKAQVGHLKLKHKSIRERFNNKPDYYFLEILEPAKLDWPITKLIFAVIVISKHGFGVRGHYA